LLNPAISNEALQAKTKADANSIQVLLIIWTIAGTTFGEKNEFWRLIQVLDLVVKLFVLTKRICNRNHLSSHAPKGSDGDEENPFYGQFV
jgi:hypothetical protein